MLTPADPAAEIRAELAEYAGNVTGQRRVSPIELMEMRRSMSAVLETFKIQALMTQAKAAIRAAHAQERMADTLASLEHGGAGVALLARLRDMPGESRAHDGAISSGAGAGCATIGSTPGFAWPSGLPPG